MAGLAPGERSSRTNGQRFDFIRPTSAKRFGLCGLNPEWSSPSRPMRSAEQRSSIRSGRTSSRSRAASSTGRPAAALPRVLV